MRIRRKHLNRMPDLIKPGNYGRWFRVSNRLLDKDQEVSLNRIVDHNMRKVKDVKGRFITNLSISIGENGTDFANDIKTVIIKYKVIKKPRFIKGYSIANKNINLDT